MYKPLDLDVDDSPAGADEDVNREDGNVSAESDDDDDACDVIADDIDTDDVISFCVLYRSSLQFLAELCNVWLIHNILADDLVR